MRAPASLLALGLLLGGCIIYETDPDACRGSRCADDTGRDPWTPPGDDTDTDDGDDTDDPALQFTLSVTEAEQGQALLAWVEGPSGFRFDGIDNVLFVGDVKVLQTELRAREAFLLLSVPCGATPGTSPVIVELADGTDVLVQGGFTVLEASSPGVCGCDA